MLGRSLANDIRRRAPAGSKLATIGRKKSPAGSRAGRRASHASRPDARELARIALDLFAERNFASVSIKDIGRAAKVNSAMIYYYYKDKEHLFRAAIDSAIDEAFLLFDLHCNNEKHESPADAIGAWFDIHVRLYLQLRNVVKISLDCKGIVGNIPKANEPIQRFYRHEREILRKFILEGIDGGIFRAVDPSIAATMISTILDGVLARSFFLKDFAMVKTVEEFKQAIWLYLGYRAGDTLPRASKRNTKRRKSQVD